MGPKMCPTFEIHHRASLGMKWTGRTFLYRKAATNTMFVGALLASICPQSTCLGHAGQLISPDASNVSLVGPVFGERVAVYARRNRKVGAGLDGVV